MQTALICLFAWAVGWVVPRLFYAVIPVGSRSPGQLGFVTFLATTCMGGGLYLFSSAPLPHGSSVLAAAVLLGSSLWIRKIPDDSAGRYPTFALFLWAAAFLIGGSTCNRGGIAFFYCAGGVLFWVEVHCKRRILGLYDALLIAEGVSILLLVSPLWTKATMGSNLQPAIGFVPNNSAAITTVAILLTVFIIGYFIQKKQS